MNLSHQISPWIVAPVFFGVWLALGWSAKKVLFLWLQRLTSKSETQLDDILIAAANTPISIMIFVWGLTVLAHIVLPGMGTVWAKNVTLASKVGTLTALVLFIDLFLVKALKMYAAKVELLRVSEALSSIIVHLLVISIGALIALDSLGISITPIIASLGIGSLAVALALQPTLENVFSGFQIMLDQSVSPGQFVRLESGEEGFVDKIGWRSTWIRQLANNMVIIPNKQLVNAQVINFNYPSQEQAVSVDFGVHYKSDLDKVERVALEVGEEVMKWVQGGVRDFKPSLRYHTFNSSSIDCTVVLRAREFVDNAVIKHEFIKALTKRFSQEGIVIPYPITALDTTQEKALISSL